MCKTPKYLTDSHGIRRYVPCGYCSECRSARVNNVALRAIGEGYLCKRKKGRAFFMTFTFNSLYLPQISFIYRNAQKTIPCFSRKYVKDFLKRLRKRLVEHDACATLKYVFVSEHGSRRGRPHHHSLFYLYGSSLSNIEFADLVRQEWSVNVGTNRKPVYESLGFIKCDYCRDTVASSRYCVKYISKDFGFEKATDYYGNTSAKSKQLRNELDSSTHFYKACLYNGAEMFYDTYFDTTQDGEAVPLSRVVCMRGIKHVLKTGKLKPFVQYEPCMFKDGKVQYEPIIHDDYWCFEESEVADFTTHNFYLTSKDLGFEWLLEQIDETALERASITLVGVKNGKQREYTYQLPSYLFKKLTQDSVDVMSVLPLKSLDKKQFKTKSYERVFFHNRKSLAANSKRVSDKCDKLARKVIQYSAEHNRETIPLDIWRTYLVRLYQANGFLIPKDYGLSPSLEKYLIPIDDEYNFISYNKYSCAYFGNSCIDTVQEINTELNTLLDPERKMFMILHDYFNDPLKKTFEMKMFAARILKIEAEKQIINDLYNTDYE